jgi:hypothetical protein
VPSGRPVCRCGALHTCCTRCDRPGTAAQPLGWPGWRSWGPSAATGWTSEGCRCSGLATSALARCRGRCFHRCTLQVAKQAVSWAGLHASGLLQLGGGCSGRDTPSAIRRKKGCGRFTEPKTVKCSPFGWKISDTNLTRGALSGYRSPKVTRREYTPPAGHAQNQHGFLSTRTMGNAPSQGVSSGPKMVAFQTNKLSSDAGLALQPCMVKTRREPASPTTWFATATHLRRLLLYRLKVAHKAQHSSGSRHNLGWEDART